MAGVGLFDLSHRTLVEPRVIDVGIVGPVHGREIIHERRCLRGVEVELRHAKHRRRTDRMRIEEELVQPTGLHLFSLADERRRQPAPGIVRFDVGIDLFLVRDNDREQQSRQIATTCRIPLAGLDRIRRQAHVLAAHNPRFAINQRVVPEHDWLMRQRLDITLLDRNAVLVYHLRLAGHGIKSGHAHQGRVTASLAIGHERFGDILLREVRRQKRVVRNGGGLAKRTWLVANVPAIHLQGVAPSTVVLLDDLEPGDPGFFARRGLVDELRRRRFSHEAEHKRHHRLPLLVVERELRHAIAFVVTLVFRLLVVVAPRGAEFLPEEALALMGQKLLEEEAGRRVDRFGREVGRGCGGVSEVRCQRFVLRDSVRRRSVGVAGRGVTVGCASVAGAVVAAAMPMLVGELMHHKVRDLFEGDLRRVLAAPVRECRTGGLRVLKTRNIVAGGTCEFRERLLSNVVEQRGIAIVGRHAQQHLLVALNFCLINAETVSEHILRPCCREAVLEIHQGQFVERLSLVHGERVGRRDLCGLPIFRRPE